MSNALKHRRVGLAILAACTALVLSGCLSNNQSKVQRLTNSDRTSHGVAPLADYTPADTKAQAWAEHLAQIGYLAHSNLTSGYQSGTWCKLGENVGMGPTIASINHGFMNSPPHRANILDPAYTHIGTGVAKNQATGYVFVVQEFVKRC